MPADDGTRLATRLLRPDDPTVRRGTVLVRSERPPDRGSPLERIAFWLAEDGRNVVLQNCRGRGASEGDFDPFADEVSDGGAALRWISEQPELTGPVVALGLGYAAFTAWAAAAALPEQVAGIAAGLGARDPYAWLYPGGVLQLETALALAARLDGRTGVDPRTLDFARAGRHRPLVECDRVAVRELAAYRAWLDHPTRDAWWQTRTPALPEVSPALLIGGWYDTAFAASYADYEALTTRSSPPALLVGPWGAASPPRRERTRATRPLITVVPALSRFVASAVGDPSARNVATRVFVGGSGWRDARPWPPPRSDRHTLFLRSGGRGNALDGDGQLSPDAPGDEPTDTFVADPADPVPSLGGASWHGVAGPLDQRSVERRGDVLCFTAAPLERALELAGRVALQLYVHADTARFDVCAKLVAVAPDGAARWLCEGVARRHRDEGDAALVVELGAVAARLAVGTRLRLEVGGSSLPRFARDEEQAGPGPRTVHHDEAHPSALLFAALDA
jgi:putative CocE/NonD family hydrolase